MASKEKLMDFLNAFIQENTEEAEGSLHEYLKEMMQNMIFEKAKKKDEDKSEKDDDKEDEKEEDESDDEEDDEKEEKDEDEDEKEDKKEDVKEASLVFAVPNKLDLKKVAPAKDETKASETSAQNKVDKQKWKKRVPAGLKGILDKRLVNEDTVEEMCGKDHDHSEDEEVKKDVDDKAEKNRKMLVKKAKAKKK